jgi:hypothetical protein
LVKSRDIPKRWFGMTLLNGIGTREARQAMETLSHDSNKDVSDMATRFFALQGEKRFVLPTGFERLR